MITTQNVRWMGVLGAAAAVLTAASLLAPGTAAPATAATTKAIDYGQLEQQIAAEINSIRQNPSKLADQLAALPTPDGINLQLPDGTSIWSDEAHRQAAVREARLQPALPPLGWSQKLASAAREGIAWANAGQPHAQLGERVKAAGATGMPIEAVYGGSATAISQAWTFWVSGGDHWDLNSPFGTDYNDPAISPRGHRGIINDNRMTAIGVACGPNTDAAAGADSARCVLIDSTKESDAAPPAAASGGQPQLSQLPDTGLTGTVGTTEDASRSTLTLSTGDPGPTESPSPTDSTSPTDSNAELTGGGLVTVDAKGNTVGTSQPPGTSTTTEQGKPWDVRGDGSLIVTVTAQDLFTPSDKATIWSFSTPATQYRAFQVKYQNNSDTPVKDDEVFLQRAWFCEDAADHKKQLPFVIDPPGQGLPSGAELGRGTSIWAFGCGEGAGGAPDFTTLTGAAIEPFGEHTFTAPRS